MRKIKHRIETLGLREIQLGVYICPGTGLYHICRNEEWLNSEKEAILDYEFYPYGVMIKKEHHEKWFFDDGRIIEIEKSYPYEWGMIRYSLDGESEKAVFYPGGECLKHGSKQFFERLTAERHGIIAEDNKFVGCFVLSNKQWLTLDGSEVFDEIFHSGDFFFCRRKKRWAIYSDRLNKWWESPDGKKMFEAIEDMGTLGIRVKESGKYKLYERRWRK